MLNREEGRGKESSEIVFCLQLRKYGLVACSTKYGGFGAATRREHRHPL